MNGLYRDGSTLVSRISSYNFPLMKSSKYLRRPILVALVDLNKILAEGCEKVSALLVAVIVAKKERLFFLLQLQGERMFSVAGRTVNISLS